MRITTSVLSTKALSRGYVTGRTFALVAALLAIGAALGTYHFAQMRVEKRAADIARTNAEAANRERQIHDAYRAEPQDDRLKFMLPVGFPRADSSWRSAERSFYEQLLARGSFDVLVVPFQVQADAVDRSSRSFMTAQLAMAIASAQKATVPDPYLVARALGDGDRRLNTTDVYRLANKLRVQRIVWGYVGHEREGALRLTIRRQDRPAGGTFNANVPFHGKSFGQIPFSDEHPPIAAYQELLPRILEVLGISTASGIVAKARHETELMSLPGSPIAMTLEQPDALRDAYYLQVLAALVPETADRTRERLIEKSLLAIFGAAPDSAGYRFAKARALMQMGLRVAALKSLGSPETVEERHLLAVLNGDLTEAAALAAQIKQGVNALLARLDVNSIRAEYGVANHANSKTVLDDFKSHGRVWQFFAHRALTEWDSWTQHENVALKRLLDNELPLPGYSLEDIVRGVVSVGETGNAENMVNLSVLNHVRRRIETEAAKWCCAPLQPRPTVLDYLDMAESIGTANLVRRAQFLAITQGSPEAALNFVGRLESAYKDHPQLTLIRSQAESDLGRRSDGAARQGYLKSSYINAANVWFWEQGQTATAAMAWHMFAEARRSDFGHFQNVYASDYPFKPFYPPAASSNVQASLRNSAYRFEPVRYLHELHVNLERRPDKFADVIQSIEGRFRGHPGLALMKAGLYESKGDVPAAVKHYRESIAMHPGHWDPYMALGKLLFENGDPAKAADLFTSYPGFKKAKSAENPVELSNHASHAGSLFFWSGHFASAMPLYRIAADLRTGSDASMQSAIRIALMNGDYMNAAVGSLERARRYNSPFAYRDYLGMLHAMGRSKEAWEGFNILVGQIDRPQIWEAALVGHRMDNWSEKQVGGWAAQDAVHKAGQQYGYASMHLLRAGVTDRLPSADLPALIAQVERPVWRVHVGVGGVVRPSLDGQSLLHLGPNARITGATLSGGVFQRAQKEQVKSDLVYFAEAYRAIRLGQFPSASALLAEAVSLYDVRNVQLGYLLPYLAFAAAKSGQAQALDQQFAKFSAAERRFDYFLAKAVVAGLAGNTAESLESLNLARYRRPFTEHRPLLSEYQFAEISEWLYEATRDTRFRNVALNWAKQNQTSQPWFAWSYAVEAKLTTNTQERRRAIAMAHYLDRESERLASISSAEIKAAIKAYASRNPFLRPNVTARRDAT